MGYMINSLGNLPVNPSVNLYVFVVNGDFRGTHFETLDRHFAGIAESIGEHGAIVRGFSSDFSDEVCKQFLGNGVREIGDLLPALLITDAPPEAIKQNTMRLLVPLKRAEKEFGNLETFFRGLADFAQNRSPGFRRRLEHRTDWFTEASRVVELKPNFLGISVNVNEFINKLRRKGR